MKVSDEQKLKNELLSCRQILAAMITFGFLMQHILQTSMPIVIVKMIAHYNSNTSSDSYFNWDENQKNDILGSYFWGNLISKVPAGRLSELHGPRIIFGVALLMTTLATFLTPTACYLGPCAAVLSRLILGISVSFFLPTVPTLMKKWVPPTSRYNFTSQLLLSSWCIFLGLIAYGYLLSEFRWNEVFYVIGCMCLVWTAAWFSLVYDCPEHHHRISNYERMEIQKAIKEEDYLNDKTEKIPWLKIFTSGPVWAYIVAFSSFTFSNSLTSSQLPSYVRQVLQVEIKNLGFLSNVPYIISYITAIVVFYIYNRLSRSPASSTALNFKIIFSLAFLIQLLLFLAQSLYGHNRILTIATFSICEVIGIGGMFMLMVNVMDLSPNFSGTIYALAAMCGDIASYLQTKVVAFYTYESQDFDHWQSVFIIVVITKVIGLVFYYVFSSRKPQKWDRNETHKNICL